MSLLSLPNEIIHDICSYYCAVHDKRLGRRPSTKEQRDSLSSLRALASLSRASRRLYAIATPLLYHVIFYDEKDPVPLRLFLRTLAQRTELASHVTAMSLGTGAAIDQSHISVIDDIMRYLDASLPKKWHHQTETTLDSASPEQDNTVSSFQHDSALRHGFAIDLILSLVGNLSQLSLAATSRTKYGKYMLPSANMDALRQLNIIGDATTGGFMVRQVKELCRKAPNLQELRFDTCMRAVANIPLQNLKSLKFENSLLAKGDLGTLAKTCSSLASFTYYCSNTWPMYESLNRSVPLLTPRDIIEELAPCNQTLEHLDIVFSDWAVQIYLSYNNVLVTSMREFSNLKTLKLNEICFYCELTESKRIISAIGGLLPDSIEVVVLDQIRPQSSQVVQELEAQARSLPNLKEFTIHKSAELDWSMREYE